VDYEPWPEAGCSLAEAARRTASSASNRLVQESDTRKTQIKAIEEGIEKTVIDHLKNGRLVAYGRLGSPDAEAQLVSVAQWNLLTRIEWQSSAAADDQAQIEFLDMRVYPPLLAPCYLDLLAGRSLAEAFQEFLLDDPEVAALGRDAVRLLPEFEAVIVRGRCQVHGFEEWPLAYEQSVMVSTVHPDPAKRSIYDGPGEPDPIEVVTAAEALKHRYRAFISILRRGELEASGIPATSGHPDVILRSVWSSPEFSLVARNGSVAQDNPQSTGRYDRLTSRWICVLLQRSTSVNSPVRDLGVKFHSKPSTHHELLSDSPTPEADPIPKSKSVARVESKSSSRKACAAWLTDMFAENKDERLYSRKELWAWAQEKWPGSLSKRQFLAVRDDAIRATGASIWGAAGAPKKSQRPNRRAD
jgi:hypothetical protein